MYLSSIHVQCYTLHWRVPDMKFEESALPYRALYNAYLRFVRYILSASRWEIFALLRKWNKVFIPRWLRKMNILWRYYVRQRDAEMFWHTQFHLFALVGYQHFLILLWIRLSNRNLRIYNNSKFFVYQFV